jgi:hypothetical protein
MSSYSVNPFVTRTSGGLMCDSSSASCYTNIVESTSCENVCATTIVSSKGTKKGIHPILYFKYIKSRIKNISVKDLESMSTKLTKAFDEAVDAGQDVLAESFLREFNRVARELLMVKLGITKYIEYDDIMKFKRSIRDGHISDTKLKDYTRIIPAGIRKRIKSLTTIFDDFVIFHYWDENAKDVKKMTPEVKAKMQDPVLFGVIAESKRMYFIADWEDAYCDLTFDEIIDFLGKNTSRKLKTRPVAHELLT